MSGDLTYILGVDIGTGSTKALAVAPSGAVLAHAQVYYPTQHPQPGYSEQDPDAVLQAVKSTIREVVAHTGRPPLAISFSCAMHGLLALDQQGTPLTPLIIWADNRSSAYATTLKQSPDGPALYTATGTPLHAMTPFSKIIWLREEQPEIFSAATMFTDIKTFILHHFFKQYLTDYSMASATGLFDIRRLQWSEAALQAAGITTGRLPLPVPGTYRINGMLPEVAGWLGIPASTPVIAGGSDGCLAQLGSHALEPGHATLTIGTSAALRMAVPAAVSDPQQRLFTYVLYNDLYVTGGASNNGGAVVQWWVQDFLQAAGDSTALLLETALALPSTELLCLPYLLGERAPVWDSEARASFVGVQPQHTPAHFLRAVLEGICYNILQIKEALTATAGPINQISVSGGFTATPAWVQLLADILEHPLHLRQEQDASAMGAVFMAMDTLGWPRPEPAPDARVFYPSPSQAYQHNYQRFARLYKRLAIFSE